LYECESSSLTLRKIKNIEGVCERGAEDNILTEEGWRKLYNEKLHNLYFPPNMIRE
jgi:hypothetical protein